MKTANLLDMMQGKWAAFFHEELPEFRLATQVAPEHCPCPVHGGSNGFRLFSDWVQTGGGICNTCGPFGNGVRVYAWAKKLAAADAEAFIRNWLLHPGRDQMVPELADVKIDYASRKKRLESVWAEALPVCEGTPAWRYLTNRGLSALTPGALSPEVIRWHPGLVQVVNGRTRRFPAIILKILQPNGDLGSLHRIFLTANGGKAPLASAKKMMPGAAKLGGAAIRLFPAAEKLMLAEGVETALGGYLLGKGRIPVWACVSATMMQSVKLPNNVSTVYILADKDANEAGLHAAEKLKTRLEAEGRTAIVHMPNIDIPAGGHKVDWLDVYVASQ